MYEIPAIVRVRGPCVQHTFLFQNANFEKALFLLRKKHFEFRSRFYFEKIRFRQVTQCLKYLQNAVIPSDLKLQRCLRHRTVFVLVCGAFGTSITPSTVLVLALTSVYPTFGVFFEVVLLRKFTKLQTSKFEVFYFEKKRYGSH